MIKNALYSCFAFLPLALLTGLLMGESEQANDLPALQVGFAFHTLDDPIQDGWDTEAFHLAAVEQLKRLSKILTDSGPVDAVDLKDLITEDFECPSLLPKELRPVFRDAAIEVARGENPGRGNRKPYRGVEGMMEAVQALVAPFEKASDIRAQFKVIRVEMGERLVKTRQYFSLSGRTTGGSLEQNALWTIQWVQPSEGGAPRITGIEVENYEQATVRSPRQTLFADCTEAVLGDNACFRSQLMRGVNHWMPRIQELLGLEVPGHQGVAIGDVNGDGLEDAYLCQTGGIPNRLFLQNQDGTARDVSEASGVDFLDLTRSALLIDIDNDGDQDLVLTPKSHLIFLANDGRGHFAIRTDLPLPGRMLTSLAAADYDHDGDLDLYVCAYSGTAEGVNTLGTPVPYHDANNGGANLLLRNQGSWQFTDVTDQAGLDHNNTRWSFAAAWEDFDGDGDQDLYVANDFGRNNLYRNDEGHFSDVAAQAGVEDIAAGMAVTWADYDGDGWMDLYVSNMFSSAGNRVTYQRQFQRGSPVETRAQFQRHARGNSLFQNTGKGAFRDVSEETGVTMGRWAWGSLFSDLNNDGWEDLLVANGFITNQKTEDL